MVGEFTKYNFGSGVYFGPVKQVGSVGLSCFISNRNMKMRTVNGKQPGERDDLKMAVEPGWLFLIRKSENSRGKAPGACHNAGRFYHFILGNPFEFLKDILTRK